MTLKRLDANKFPWNKEKNMRFEDGWYGGGTPILEKEQTIDNYLQVIKENLIRKEKTINSLRETIKTVRDEKYASEEMQKMQEEVKQAKHNLHNGFPITDEEWKSIKEWRHNHDVTVHKNPQGYHGVSGGGFTYIFYPTAIGTAGVCRCGACHRKALREACKDGEYDEKKYLSLMREWHGEYEFQELG